MRRCNFETVQSKIYWIYRNIIKENNWENKIWENNIDNNSSNNIKNDRENHRENHREKNRENNRNNRDPVLWREARYL